MVYNFNYQWKFMLADAFPLSAALQKHKDQNGRYFYEPEYDVSQWKSVSVPHTFNDGELFSTRIEDGGANQTRTFSFYRKKFRLDEPDGKKILLEFEGIRQSCFLYVNGKLTGYYENGVAPFGFDISAYVHKGENVIAVATDNTCTRNVPYCMAETPNYPDVEPGSYMAELDPDTVEPDRRGVGFFWNCNDFNPSLGGLTRNISLHIKPLVYLTLPLYTNLKTTGTYIYEADKRITVEAEIRNESGAAAECVVENTVYSEDGAELMHFRSASKMVNAHELPEFPPLSIIPKDAYVKNGDHYEAVNDEGLLAPTEFAAEKVSVVKASAAMADIKPWSVGTPYLYKIKTTLIVDGEKADEIETVTGFRTVDYDNTRGIKINGEPVWLTGYAQRSANEWAAVGAACDWLRDFDARLVRESNANHIRWMHIAACPADIRSCDRYGIVCTQPAGDKERENFGRRWRQRMELMRDVIIYFRNSPSILFWEVGNNAVNAGHMRQMRLMKEQLDPNGGRRIGCRTLSTPEVVAEAEYVGTMLNRHAGRFQSELMPILETEYLREESPRRVWDDFSPPDYDYDNIWAGKGGLKAVGVDVHDLTAEDFAIRAAMGYSEFFNDRMGGASGKDLYSAAVALCWTDSAQHGRQSGSENARMSGRVDAARVRKQSFDVFRVMQNEQPEIKILGHWNYPKKGGDNYKYPLKEFNGSVWVKTGEYDYRNPEKKTVYVVGSYPVARVELYINGSLAGVCDKPEYTFIFRFDGIDVTQSGCIEAKAYGYDNRLIAEDKLVTAGIPAKIRLTPNDGGGLLADGSDTAFVDIEITDKRGVVCPLCFERIDFKLTGEGAFLGGYNSGRYNGFGKNDSVIHQNHVYAECGTNRVFIRATDTPGIIKLTASMKGLPESEIEIISHKTDISALSADKVKRMAGNVNDDINRYAFEPIPQADAVKYVPEDKIICKVLIDADEADLRGMRAEVINDAVYGPIQYVLDRINRVYPNRAEYEYDTDNGIMRIKTGGNTIELQKGHTHMLVNGAENLLNGEPEIHDGIMVAEISAIAPFIDGASARYDDNVKLYRIEFKN